jgi:hypothetical protein
LGLPALLTAILSRYFQSATVVKRDSPTCRFVDCLQVASADVRGDHIHIGHPPNSLGVMIASRKVAKAFSG